MDFIILLLKQNILMFMYLLIGYYLYRKKLLSASGNADLGRMLLHIIMPAAILKSYLADYSARLLKELFVSFFAALLSLLLAIIISRIFFSKEHGIERFSAAFSNAGFIGIPNVAIFAQLYQNDYIRAVKEVCLSTLLCIFTLPAILGMANYIL